MYEVLCDTPNGPVVVDRFQGADEAYLLACALQAEGKTAWVPMPEAVMA